MRKIIYDSIRRLFSSSIPSSGKIFSMIRSSELSVPILSRYELRATLLSRVRYSLSVSLLYL